MARNISRRGEKGQTPLDDLSGLLVEVKTRQQLNDLEFKNNADANRKYFLKKSSTKLQLTYEQLRQVHKDMF